MWLNKLQVKYRYNVSLQLKPTSYFIFCVGFANRNFSQKTQFSKLLKKFIYVPSNITFLLKKSSFRLTSLKKWITQNFRFFRPRNYYCLLINSLWNNASATAEWNSAILQYNFLCHRRNYIPQSDYITYIRTKTITTPQPTHYALPRIYQSIVE